MSTSPAEQPAPSPITTPSTRELRIYSHSNLFYWWPVWACGFLMAILTYIDGSRMALVPGGDGVVVMQNAEVTDSTGNKTLRNADAIVVPKEAGRLAQGSDGKAEQPRIHMSKHKELGVLFALVLLVIIVISNVPLHGLWSVIVILGIVLLTLIFALWGVLGTLLETFRMLQIHINAGGYLFISTVLFIIWLVTVFVFDHRRYVAFTSGQVRVSLAIGAGETVYPTRDMTFQKRQDDLFRHWIVGLGSGDLIIHRTGTKEEIDMPNVLFVGSKIREIEKLIKEQEVV
jgi:hypothetical protein